MENSKEVEAQPQYPGNHTSPASQCPECARIAEVRRAKDVRAQLAAMADGPRAPVVYVNGEQSAQAVRSHTLPDVSSLISDPAPVCWGCGSDAEVLALGREDRSGTLYALCERCARFSCAWLVILVAPPRELLASVAAARAKGARR